MSLYATPEAREAARNAIVITGSTRTGSTMMGQLFHSLAEVEYTFEPPHLYALFPLIETLPREVWTFLYDSYIYEDLVVGAVTGRCLNTNRTDDSSVFRAKPAAEIEARLNTAFRRPDICRVAATRRFAHKTVDVTPYLGRFRSYYPDAPVIALVRKPASVIVSVMGKGWNTDEHINGQARVFPLKRPGNPNVPYWVPDADIDRFLGMSELDRCVYYYCRMFEGIAEAEDFTVVDYDRFVRAPKAAFDRLIGGLGLSYGPMTAELVGKVAEPERDRSVDLSGADPVLVRRMNEIAEACRAKAQD